MSLARGRPTGRGDAPARGGQCPPRAGHGQEDRAVRNAAPLGVPTPVTSS
jgi:hypothetical protein